MSFTELMALERIDATTFRSIARPYAPGNGNTAFGGHVYAQAVYAAAQTVGKGFLVHVCRCPQAHGLFSCTARFSRCVRQSPHD